jgi:integrase
MGRAKRAMTGRLPSNWRQQVWGAIPATNLALRNAVAVLELTGCRPCELQKGVVVTLENDPELGTVLVFRVLGAKVGRIRDRKGNFHDRGQPERHLAVPLASAAAQYLAERIAQVGGLVIRYHRKSISNRLNEIGRELFPRRRELLSAYCYRHAFCSDLKDTVADGKIRAAALGHLSDYSQGLYGRPSRSGKGTQEPPILDAFGSRQVKHSPKMDRLLRFKIGRKNRDAEKDK